MERYSEYKDSGVKWLGEIPSHWNMQRWRFLLVENTEKNSDCTIRTQLQFRYGNIVRKANQGEDSDALETISKYTIVDMNDIMINGLNLNYDFVSQRVAQVKEKGVITSAYISLRPTEIADSRYYTYFLKSMDSKKMFHGMGTGIRLTLSYNELKNQFIPNPSLNEQRAIANYLDSVTAKIDETIAQQQKMIDLLNERKQIIINKAVTKGLDSNVKMKPSGIDWIGEIPEHWEIRKASLCVDISNGSDPKTEGDVPVYGSGSNSFRTCGEYKEGPCVLIGRKGATLHIPHYIEGRYWNVDTAFDVKTKSNDILLEFYYLLATQFDYKYYISQTTLPSMTSFDYNRMKLPIPPLREQMKIIEYVKLSTNSIDSAIKSAEKLISLLQERKQIIINDVVTGKIKVV